MLKNFKSNLFVESYEYNNKDINETMTNFHYHDYYEIYYLVSGKRRYLINYNVYDIEEGDIVLIDKRDLHMATQLDGYPCERIVMNFNDEYLSAFGENFKVILDCFKVNHVKLPVNQKKNINTLFTKILREYNNKELFSETLLNNYIYELLAMIYRYIYSVHVVLPDNDVTGSIDKAIRYIYKNFRTKLSLTEISDICHMNPSYFSRLFKKTTGINLVSYINTIRIKEAASLLIDTDMSVLEISQACGFDNLQHFCGMFKKFKGVSARQFRNDNSFRKNNEIIR